MTTKTKPRMVAEWAKCRGCQICELICSFKFVRAFNPLKAELVVERRGGATEFEVYFKEGCDSCGSCARYCLYGAISREGQTVEAQEGVIDGI